MSTGRQAMPYVIGIGTGVSCLLAYSFKVFRIFRIPYLTTRQPDPSLLRITELEEVLAAKEDEIRVLEDKAERVTARSSALDVEIARVKQEQDSTTSHAVRLENELSRHLGQIVLLQDKLTTQLSQLHSIKNERDALELGLSQVTSLLQVRTEELETAKLFLGQGEALWSDAEVIGMIEALNGEILQMGAIMAESFKFGHERQAAASKPGNGHAADEVVEPAVEEAQRPYMQEVVDILGERMTELLEHSEHHEDPILVQMALQAAMCAFANWIISSWFFQGGTGEELLEDIYDHLRNTEEQSVSGRWRVLTRRYAQKLLPERPDLSGYFFDAFNNILRTAGVQDTPGEDLRGVIVMRFQDQLDRIIDRCVELNRTFGESSTSCELLPLYVDHEAPFDASTMTDTFRETGSPNGKTKMASSARGEENVLCSTDLGVLKAERLQGKEGQFSKTVLLKPKIVLQSALDEIIAAADSEEML